MRHLHCLLHTPFRWTHFVPKEFLHMKTVYEDVWSGYESIWNTCETHMTQLMKLLMKFSCIHQTSLEWLHAHFMPPLILCYVSQCFTWRIVSSPYFRMDKFHHVSSLKPSHVFHMCHERQFSSFIQPHHTSSQISTQQLSNNQKNTKKRIHIWEN